MMEAIALASPLLVLGLVLLLYRLEVWTLRPGGLEAPQGSQA